MKNYTDTHMSDELLDIVSEPPTWIMRGGAGVITGILGLFLLGTWVIKYPEVLTGNAVITTRIQPIRVMAPMGGRMTSLLAKDEMLVKKGAVLAETENTTQLQNIPAIRKLIAQTRAFLANPQRTIFFPGTQFSWGDLQNDFNAIRQNYLDVKRLQSDNLQAYRIKNRQHQADELRQMIAVNEHQKQLNEEAFQNTEERFQGDEKLFKEGVFSKFDYLASKNKRLEKQREREDFQKEILSNHLKLNEIEREVQEIGYVCTEKKRLCLDNIERSLYTLENSLRHWQQNYLITAPADGRLVFLKSLTENQYLKAADTLFALMPVDETLMASVEIPVRGMGKARVGQKVIIKLDDYPYQEFGMLEGNVVSLEPSLTIHTYRVMVSLPNGLTSTYHQKFRFKSEMAGTAQIVTTDLRLIEHAFYGLRKLVL
ncbi:HlyD family efflux transporter periplasmic adaptor subunit [Spirosoma areae]